jgi:hypothetical protein
MGQCVTARIAPGLRSGRTHRAPCYRPAGCRGLGRRDPSGGCATFLARALWRPAAARHRWLKANGHGGSIHGDPILFYGPHRLPSPERVVCAKWLPSWAGECGAVGHRP